MMKITGLFLTSLLLWAFNMHISAEVILGETYFINDFSAPNTDSRFSENASEYSTPV